MRLLAVMIALPVAFAGWQGWRDHQTEQLLAPVASGVAGRTVEVECQSLWGSLLDAQARHGEVWFGPDGKPEGRIFLDRATCSRLRAFAGAGRHAELDCLRFADWASRRPVGTACYEAASPTVYALLVLGHEAYHTAGVRSESAANCLATQAIGYVATALGAEPDEAESAARAMAALLPFQRGDYATTACVPGGGLDVAPETADFPVEATIVAPAGRGAELADGGR
jgi:hypothetical protein